MLAISVLDQAQIDLMPPTYNKCHIIHLLPTCQAIHLSYTLVCVHSTRTESGISARITKHRISSSNLQGLYERGGQEEGEKEQEDEEADSESAEAEANEEEKQEEEEKESTTAAAAEEEKEEQEERALGSDGSFRRSMHSCKCALTKSSTAA